MFPEGRFFDFAIVAILALIIIGPKDLPIAMRKLGQFMARMRGMAAEFRASFDEMARQSELDELRKEVEALRNAQPSALAAQAVGLGDTHADIAETFADINAGLATGEVQFSPAMGGYQHPEEPAPQMAPLPTPNPTPAAVAEPAPSDSPADPPKPKRPRAPRKPKSEAPS
ncbi:MAG: twin-arginine translocase subunit TatB [Proteobacteria bacterium]|nr:twin-arginine translocase subunit TatB [Pseudomonadota bacterium]